MPTSCCSFALAWAAPPERILKLSTALFCLPDASTGACPFSILDAGVERVPPDRTVKATCGMRHKHVYPYLIGNSIALRATKLS